MHGVRWWECKICASEYNREWRRKHAEELRDYSKKYYVTHIIQHKQTAKLWRKANSEKIRMAKKEKYNLNKVKILEAQRNYNNVIRNRVMGHYSQGTPKCLQCGFSNMNALSIDHINGDGAKHRREVGGGYRIYLWLIRNNYPDGFQVLCYNCNWLKRLGENTKGIVKNEKKNETTLTYFRRTKEFVFKHYSQDAKPKCKFCKTDDLRVLSIDHINGGGSRERKLVGFGNTFYIWLVKNNFPDGYQVLCMNCQMIKRAKNKESRRIDRIPINNSSEALDVKNNLEKTI